MSVAPDCGICVLAGGLSARMGRDKARLRLGRRTLLGHVRAAAQALGVPVRVIRRDLVPRCGPLGGVYTALKTHPAAAELFLACDMPFVSAELLAGLLADYRAHGKPVFVAEGKLAGFPFLLPRTSLPRVEAQLRKRAFSLQQLARALGARLLQPPVERRPELFNINTPADWETARGRWKPPV